MEKGARVAELHYSPEYGKLEVLLPHGTKLADFERMREGLFNDDILARLPRGCAPCMSGEPLIIKERYEHVLRIDLDRMEAIEHLGPQSN